MSEFECLFDKPLMYDGEWLAYLPEIGFAYRGFIVPLHRLDEIQNEINDRSE